MNKTKEKTKLRKLKKTINEIKAIKCKLDPFDKISNH